jgi:hypothetical protein
VAPQDALAPILLSRGPSPRKKSFQRRRDLPARPSSSPSQTLQSSSPLSRPSLGPDDWRRAGAAVLLPRLSGRRAGPTRRIARLLPKIASLVTTPAKEDESGGGRELHFRHGRSSPLRHCRGKRGCYRCTRLLLNHLLNHLVHLVYHLVYVLVLGAQADEKISLI